MGSRASSRKAQKNPAMGAMNIRRRNRTQPPRLILASSNRGNSELFVVPGEAAQDSENTARAMVVDLQGTSLELLVQECKAGSREAFSALVEHYQKRLFNFLCHLTGNAHDAEDLTQETFLKVYHNIHRFNSTHAFGTWLFTIAKRTAYNHFRKNKRSQPAPPEEQEQVDPEDPSS